MELAYRPMCYSMRDGDAVTKSGLKAAGLPRGKWAGPVVNRGLALC